MGNIEYGILHNHSEFSIRDSAMSIKRMFERAKELGATAIALTDHGILTGFYDFMKLGKEYGIKPIPGIEAYYTPDGKVESDTRRHLILMAKDMVGFRAICDANYQSYQYVYCSSAGDFPRMDRQILLDCFGPGSSGHGHVFATSACMQGVLSQILLANDNVEVEAEKVKMKRDKYHPIDDELLDALKTEEDMEQEIKDLIAQRESLNKKSKESISGINRRLKAIKDTSSEEYKAVEAELENTKKRKDDAKVKLESIKKTIAEKKRAKTAYSNTVKKMKESASKWSFYNDQADEIMASKEKDETLYQKAWDACADFTSIFGAGNFFVELQYHHITAEAKVMPILAKLAKELNVPVVAANDAHYATNSYEEVRARTLMAAMRFNKPIEAPGEGFGELYMKSEDDLLSTLSEILDEDTASLSLANIRIITDACNVELKHDTHYPVFVGGVPGETASQRLRRLAEEGIPKRYPGGLWLPEYQERMDYELSVIDKMGYSDYLCIVQDFLDYGRSLGYDCPEKIGYTIGPGRGSAVGSIVCYLSGITSVDPMKYGLLFERFLNPERVSMPDIDSDFATEIRDTVVDYVRNKYNVLNEGKKATESICGIITKGTLAGRAAIRAIGRVTDIPESIVDSTARLVPMEPGAKIDDIPNLTELCENAVVKRLIDDAKLVEGTAFNYGVHAAGIIIADNGDVSQYVPLQYNAKKDLWAAQCDMGQCERDAGLLKMDFLGLKNLSIITDTLRRIYRNYGVRIDIERVPMEPEVFGSIFCNGNTNCVFQFESGGMKDMIRQFQPTSMEDIILLVAAYRPGPMQYIPDIIQVKHGKKVPHYIADGLEEILAPTYGYPIYQEQVMQIFNRCADFSLGESDIIRRIMSKKHPEELDDPKTNYHGKFIEGLIRHGANRAEAEDYWTQLLDFAKYAFNKSHASAYAHVAYNTAWLKRHYPGEYLCSVMSRTEAKRLPVLINHCRKMGLTIEPPDINRSQDDFTNTSTGIVFGFGNIKGVGNSGIPIVEERNANGPFTSVKDFVTRMLRNHPKAYNKSVVESLIKTGAFDVFCSGNRASLLESINDFADITKKMMQKQDEVDRRKAVLADLQSDIDTNEGGDPGDAEDAIRKAAKSLKSAENSLSAQRELYVQHTFPLVTEDRKTKLNAEYDLLGFFISGSPFEEYQKSANKIKWRSDIADTIDVENSRDVTVCGIVKDLMVFQRKSDGRPFCGASLFDSSGEIEVKCFTKPYEKFGALIDDNAALCVKGKIRIEKNVLDDGTEVEFGRYISIDEVSLLQPDRTGSYILSGDTMVDWYTNYDAIRAYEDPSGYELCFFDRSLRELRKCNFSVSASITSAEFPGLLISKTEAF